jgi:hypothetical protein
MPKGEREPKVRNHLTRVVVPIVGLLAVTTALALVGIAPIVLFPPSKDAGPRPIPPSASSQVASVAAPPVQPSGGSTPVGPAESPNEPGAAAPPAGTRAEGPNTPEGGGTIAEPQKPSLDRPAEVARPGDGSADEEQGEGKQKTKNGKALGHSKDKAKGNAKGHSKWQGQASVAFPPRAAKPGHVHPSSAAKHSGRRHRPHARPRG